MSYVFLSEITLILALFTLTMTLYSSIVIVSHKSVIKVPHNHYDPLYK